MFPQCQCKGISLCDQVDEQGCPIGICNLPSAPPLSIGNWQVTAIVWQSWDFPAGTGSSKSWDWNFWRSQLKPVLKRTREKLDRRESKNQRPVRNSPKSSVMDPVSKPPFNNLSSSFDPVVIWEKNYKNISHRIRFQISTWIICDRFRCISVAVVKPVGTFIIGLGSNIVKNI